MVKPREIETNRYYADIKSRRLIVRRGWDDNVAKTLVHNSHEVEIVEHHARDSRKRFEDLKKANIWFENNQPMAIYTLALARTAELAGVIWIAPPEERIPEAELAFSLRMYEVARGREFAVSFGRAALFDYETQNPSYDGDLGLKVNREYTDEVQTYKELDFDQVGKLKPTELFTTMIRPGFISRLSISTRRHK